jgi:hypothetical protein
MWGACCVVWALAGAFWCCFFLADCFVGFPSFGYLTWNTLYAAFRFGKKRGLAYLPVDSGFAWHGMAWPAGGFGFASSGELAAALGGSYIRGV